MQIKSYQNLAKVYNHLMRNLGYEQWAQYILDIMEEVNLQHPSVLEYAAGTGNIAGILFDKVESIVISDLSKEMLQEGKNNLNKVCCDMSLLPFKCKYDFIYCTFDSINYLTEESKVDRMLDETKNLLSGKGYFTFDVSLENNSLRYQRYLNRKGRFNGIKYKQKNKYDRQKKIHYNYFFIKDSEGNITEEIHKEKIYDLNFYYKAISKSGLNLVWCRDIFTTNEANDKSERVQFLVNLGI